MPVIAVRKRMRPAATTRFAHWHSNPKTRDVDVESFSKLHVDHRPEVHAVLPLPGGVLAGSGLAAPQCLGS